MAKTMKRGDYATILPTADVDSRHHGRTAYILKDLPRRKGIKRYELICQETTMTISEEHLQPQRQAE